MATTPDTSAMSGSFVATDPEDFASELPMLWAECGFLPTDDLEGGPDQPEWLDRWEAFIRIPDGFIVSSERDDDLGLYVLTPNGAVQTSARFDVSELGFRLFAGAVDALSEEA